MAWSDPDDFSMSDFTDSAAEDFVQIAPDDSAYVDIDTFEANVDEFEPAF